MRLSRIYVDQSLAVGSKIIFDKETSHYIRNVLRLKADTTVALFNGNDECDFKSRIEYEGKKTLATAFEQHEYTTESQLDSEIIQGLARSDHIDLSIQKCTELGVRRISIFNAEHSQIPLKSSQQDKRLSHWQAIAIKACEQCGRHRPPVIAFFHRFEQAIENSHQRENKLLLDFDGPALPELLSKSKIQTQVSILIGPEGGFSSQEIKLANEQGFVSARMGPRVLRTETASMASMAIIQSIWGDLTD